LKIPKNKLGMFPGPELPSRPDFGLGRGISLKDYGHSFTQPSFLAKI